tara:strand:+ start:220 stop:447 length:228 start_codon:yes stop_codon:yes gene_type:complete
MTKPKQERMSLTFTKKDAWIKNEIEKEAEDHPYWTKTGIIKNALIEHFSRRKVVEKNLDFEKQSYTERRSQVDNG